MFGKLFQNVKPIDYLICLDTGAHGVGRRHIKNTLIMMHPKRFAYPIPRKCLVNLYLFISL